MSVWGFIALTGLVIMAVEVVFKGRNRTVGYLAVMAMITLGVLIDLGLIDKDSTLVWLMPALAVIALIAVLGRKFGKQLPLKT